MGCKGLEAAGLQRVFRTFSFKFIKDLVHFFHKDPHPPFFSNSIYVLIVIKKILPRHCLNYLPLTRGIPPFLGGGRGSSYFLHFLRYYHTWKSKSVHVFIFNSWKISGVRNFWWSRNISSKIKYPVFYQNI